MSVKNVNSSDIKEKLLKFLEDGKLTDCKFLVGYDSDKNVICAHKLVLAVASPVFECMLYGTLSQENEVIEIDDIRPNIFRSLLQYMYTEEAEVKSFEDATELYYAAEKYMIKSLVKNLAGSFNKYVNCDNVCQAYEFAKLHGDEPLQAYCMQFIAKNVAEVSHSKAFYDAHHVTVLNIFEKTRNNISDPFFLFDVLERYIAYQTLNDVKTADDTSTETVFLEKYDADFIIKALQKINYSSLSPSAFIQRTKNSKLLPKTMSYDILVCLVLGTPVTDVFLSFERS